MNDINKLFFELIRVAIGNQVCLSHTPSADEWVELYAMAKKQSLVGVCFAGVQRLQKQQQCPPEKLYLQWMGMAAKIQQKNEVMNRQCVEVQRMLSEAGFKSAILKGQGVGTLYRVYENDDDNENLSLLRQSGDIDVYVEGGMEKVLDWCREKYGKVEFDYINAHVPVYTSTDSATATEVEVHWRVQAMTNLFANIRLQEWFKSSCAPVGAQASKLGAKVQSSILGGKVNLKLSGITETTETSIVVPTAEFNAFYVLLHAYNHLLGEGLGLRQLMDYYFVLLSLERELPQINRELSVNALMKEFGMEKFARGVMWIMQYVFEGKNSINHTPSTIHLQIEPDEKAGRFILNEVMTGGNFGHHDERKVRLSDNGRWQSVWNQLQHAVRMARFAPMNVFWQPVWVLYHFVWKRTTARKWL